MLAWEQNTGQNKSSGEYCAAMRYAAETVFFWILVKFSKQQLEGLKKYQRLKITINSIGKFIQQYRFRTLRYV